MIHGHGWVIAAPPAERWSGVRCALEWCAVYTSLFVRLQIKYLIEWVIWYAKNEPSVATSFNQARP